MKYKLKDIFDLQMGKTPSRNHLDYWNTNEYKWISISDLSKSGKYILDTKEYISENAVKESGIKVIPANTVIMSFKLSIGKTAITAEDMYSNEAIMAFHDKHVVEILPEYIYYLFNFMNWDVGSNKAVMGKTLNKKTLSEVKIEICPIEEQKEIVKVLDKLMDILSGRVNELTLLNNLIKARFVELFGDPVLNPFSWEMKRFDEICENLDSRRKPISSDNRVKGIYPYYGASGIVDCVEDYIFDEDILLVSEDGANLLMRSTPIAFSVSGKVWVNNHAHVVRFDKMSLQKYVEIYFSLIDISDSITGSAQPKLNQAKLSAIMIPVPEGTLLDSYCEFLYQVDKSKVVVRKALEETQILFDSLMQQYFG